MLTISSAQGAICGARNQTWAPPTYKTSARVDLTQLALQALHTQILKYASHLTQQIHFCVIYFRDLNVGYLESENVSTMVVTQKEKKKKQTT